MRKIAFVVVRYGLDINGGAEYHCRMIAERLAEKYDTEVLTTCVKDYVKGGNDFEPGVSEINGVTVRRFPVKPYDKSAEKYWYRRTRRARSIRKRLGRCGLLPVVSVLFPQWKWQLKADEQVQKHSVFYSEEMVNFIADHKGEYDAIFAFTADYAPFYFTAMTAGEKMIGIPTLHDAKVSYRTSLTEAFPKIKYVGFNTVTEQELARRIFGKGLKANGIISVGIDTVEPAPWEAVKEKFALPDRYLCFVGRVCVEKLGMLADYYDAYRKKVGGDAVPLVLVGSSFGESIKLPEGCICTGFVSDEEKRSIMQHATVFVNPSKFESLSLVLLEALNDRVPVLVNGRCNVLKGHCEKSSGAIKYYMGSRSFVKMLRRIISDASMRADMQNRGEKYFRDNYSWDLVMARLEDAINFVSRG